MLRNLGNRRRGKNIYGYTRRLSEKLWSLSRPNNEISMNAGWYGNDTVWRMVMDINLIAQFGRLDGTLAGTPQRVIYSLCDGIIGGQGNGPLQPEPLPLGFLTFSNDSYLMDEVMGYLFNLDIEKVPLLREASIANKQKIVKLLLNGNQVNMDIIKTMGMTVKLAPGWVNYNQ